jgi:hypothetical protein
LHQRIRIEGPFLRGGNGGENKKQQRGAAHKIRL